MFIELERQLWEKTANKHPRQIHGNYARLYDNNAHNLLVIYLSVHQIKQDNCLQTITQLVTNSEISNQHIIRCKHSGIKYYGDIYLVHWCPFKTIPGTLAEIEWEKYLITNNIAYPKWQQKSLGNTNSYCLLCVNIQFSLFPFILYLFF